MDLQKAVLDIDSEAERMSKMDVISKDVPMTDDNLINEDLSCSRPEDVEGRYLLKLIYPLRKDLHTQIVT